MISVVVPTMWKYPPFASFLNQVLNHKLVHDVILINNDSHQTPTQFKTPHPKLTMLDYGENIFVNPAWNTGVMHAACDIICIMNDDIVFDLRIFHRIHEWFQPHHGCVGLQGDQPVQGDIQLCAHTNQSCFGFGQLMFVHAQNWVDIPANLLVYFGDNWIFDVHKKKWGSNYLIRNLMHVTPHAQTAQHQVHRLDAERLHYMHICAQMQVPHHHE